MFKTIVLFRSNYKRIWIDALATINWTDVAHKAQAVEDLLLVARTAEEKERILSHRPKEIESFLSAAEHMKMRGRFNQDIRGPYVFDSEHKPEDAALIEWARKNIYEAENPVRPNL